MVVDTIAPPPSAAVGPFTCLLELLATFFIPSAQASAELAAAIPRRRPRLRLGSKGYRPVARHLSLKRTRATRPQRAQPTPPGGAARLPASDRGRQHRVTFLPGLTYTPGQGRARGGVARIVTWLPGNKLILVIGLLFRNPGRKWQTAALAWPDFRFWDLDLRGARP